MNARIDHLLVAMVIQALGGLLEGTLVSNAVVINLTGIHLFNKR